MSEGLLVETHHLILNTVVPHTDVGIRGYLNPTLGYLKDIGYIGRDGVLVLNLLFRRKERRFLS